MKKSIAAMSLAIASLSVCSTAVASPASQDTTPTHKTAHDPGPSKATIDAAIAQHVRDIESGKAYVGNSPVTTWKLNGYEITVTSVQHGTVMPVILASCGVGGSGGTCKINRTATMKGSISAGAGLNIEAFNANTSYTIEGSVSTSIESTSPHMNSRQMYVARPQGTFYIFKWKNYDWGVNNASGSGTAFSPTGVQFRVVPV